MPLYEWKASAPNPWYYLFGSSEDPDAHITQIKSDTPKVLAAILPVVLHDNVDSTVLSNGGVLVESRAFGKSGAWAVAQTGASPGVEP